jgi:phosphoribosyl 1,2-cyclic phosphodiesterase
MGTGAAVLGQELMERGGPRRGHVLISHMHWDHIQGIPFFAPFRVPGSVWDIYAPRSFGQSLRETLAGQMQYTYFPITLEQLGATIRYHELVEGRLSVGDIEVTSRYLNHPALTLGYRLEADGVAVVYACDHEPHSRAIAAGSGRRRPPPPRRVPRWRRFGRPRRAVPRERIPT